MTTGGALNAVGVRLNYNQAVKYIDTMNRYGVDSMFFNNTLGLIFSLYEEGKIGKSDLGGLEIKRDFDSILNIGIYHPVKQYNRNMYLITGVYPGILYESPSKERP